MRILITILLLVFSFSSYAQLGGCDDNEGCSTPINKVVVDASQSTVGASSALFTPNIGIIGDGNTSNTESIETIQAFIDQYIDYDAPTININNLNPPDTPDGSNTDASFIEFYANITQPISIGWNFTGEGFIRIELDACGCGEYEIASEVYNPVSGPNTSATVNLEIGIHKLRVTQVDVEGTNNLWTYNGPSFDFYDVTGDAPIAKITELLVDCDGNFTNLDGSVVLGDIYSQEEFECPTETMVKVDNVMGLELSKTYDIECYQSLAIGDIIAGSDFVGQIDFEDYSFSDVNDTHTFIITNPTNSPIDIGAFRLDVSNTFSTTADFQVTLNGVQSNVISVVQNNSGSLNDFILSQVVTLAPSQQVNLVIELMTQLPAGNFIELWDTEGAGPSPFMIPQAGQTRGLAFTLLEGVAEEINVAFCSDGTTTAYANGVEILLDTANWSLCVPNDYNTPSQICLSTPIQLGAGGIAAGEPSDTLHGFIVKLNTNGPTAQDIFTTAPAAQEQYLIAAYYDSGSSGGNGWLYSDNSINGTVIPNGTDNSVWPPYVPQMGDSLIASVVLANGPAGGSVFLSDLQSGSTGGVPHALNLGGLDSIVGNTYTNGSNNTGEFFATGVLSGSVEYANLQLDGNYVVQSDSTVLSVEQAIDQGWAACNTTNPAAPEFTQSKCANAVKYSAFSDINDENVSNGEWLQSDDMVGLETPTINTHNITFNSAIPYNPIIPKAGIYEVRYTISVAYDANNEAMSYLLQLDDVTVDRQWSSVASGTGQSTQSMTLKYIGELTPNSEIGMLASDLSNDVEVVTLQLSIIELCEEDFIVNGSGGSVTCSLDSLLQGDGNMRYEETCDDGTVNVWIDTRIAVATDTTYALSTQCEGIIDSSVVNTIKQHPSGISPATNGYYVLTHGGENLVNSSFIQVLENGVQVFTSGTSPEGPINPTDSIKSYIVYLEAGNAYTFRTSTDAEITNPFYEIRGAGVESCLAVDEDTTYEEGFGVDIVDEVITVDTAELFSNVPNGFNTVCAIANAAIDVQDVNDNGLIEWTQNLTTGAWVDNGDNTFSYQGNAEYIVINAQVHQEIANGGNIQRPAPVLHLERSNDGGANWTIIATSANGYIRDVSDHEESSNNIFYRDIQPPQGSTYRLFSEQEGTIGGVVTSTLGQFDLEACENF